MSSNARIAAIVFVVFAIAVGGALFFLRQEPAKEPKASGGGSSEIWKVGDSWTVQVKQDGGAIAPDGEENLAKIPFHFTVIEAPETKDGLWTVQVKQEGAEGPFAEGWRLFYAERGGEMVLEQVAMGRDKPLEAEVATIVLGAQFPYEVRYDAAPKDGELTASKLLERSELPPAAAAPGTKGSGADEGLPEAPPLADAVAPPSNAPVTPKR